jgi:hypothetical protein
MQTSFLQYPGKFLPILALCAGLATLAAVTLTRDREPEYQGKPLRYWAGLLRTAQVTTNVSQGGSRSQVEFSATKLSESVDEFSSLLASKVSSLVGQFRQPVLQSCSGHWAIP